MLRHGTASATACSVRPQHRNPMSPACDAHAGLQPNPKGERMFFREHLSRVATRAAAGLVAIGALAVLASCGGGTYQVTSFVPVRLISFGEESSHLEGAQGLKYSINGLTGSQIDCNVSPIWNQYVAGTYGLVFANCNPNASNNISALDLTTVGGTVDDVVNQVAAFQAGDTFNYNDLVTIWVGMHDVLDQYQTNGS